MWVLLDEVTHAGHALEMREESRRGKWTKDQRSSRDVVAAVGIAVAVNVAKCPIGVFSAMAG